MHERTKLCEDNFARVKFLHESKERRKKLKDNLWKKKLKKVTDRGKGLIVIEKIKIIKNINKIQPVQKYLRAKLFARAKVSSS